MAPNPKGGKGGSSFGGGSSSSSDDDYDTYGSNYYGDDDDYNYGSSGIDYYADANDAINAIRAAVAFAFLLMIAAVATSIMVLQKSWLRGDGVRDKMRMIIFLVCTLFVFISQASYAGYTISLLVGPTSVGGFVAAAVIARLFDWMASIALFLLVLFEVTRSPDTTHPKSGLVEKVNFGVIGFLTVIGLIAWATFTRYFVALFGTGYSYFGYGNGILSTLSASSGLTVTFTVVSFLFAFEMLVLGIMAFVGKKVSKSRGILLLVFLSVFWLNRLIALAGSALAYTLVDIATPYGLQCFLDILWIALLVLLALLARASNKVVSSGELNAAAATTGVQPNPGAPQGEKPDVAPTPMTATSGPVSSIGPDGQQQPYYQQPQQQQYIPQQQQYMPPQQQQTYNQYPVQDAPQPYQQYPQQVPSPQPYTEMPGQNAPPQQPYSEMPTTVAAPQANVQHPPQDKA